MRRWWSSPMWSALTIALTERDVLADLDPFQQAWAPQRDAAAPVAR